MPVYKKLVSTQSIAEQQIVRRGVCVPCMGKVVFPYLYPISGNLFQGNGKAGNLHIHVPPRILLNDERRKFKIFVIMKMKIHASRVRSYVEITLNKLLVGFVKLHDNTKKLAQNLLGFAIQQAPRGFLNFQKFFVWDNKNRVNFFKTVFYFDLLMHKLNSVKQVR